MQHARTFRKLVAVTTVVALHLVLSGGFAASGLASVRGTVVMAGTWAPHSGVVMHATNLETGETFRSDPTSAAGEFRMPGLPSASYSLTAETDAGMYPVERPVVLADGSEQVLNVVLNKANQAKKAGASPGKKPTLWSNPLTATGIVLGAAVVMGVLVDAIDDDDSGPASPANP